MIDKIKKICEVQSEVDLKKYNTFRLESKCAFLARPSNTLELKKLINLLKEENLKYFVIGNASNIILPEYYDGVIIKLDKFNKYEIHEDYLYAECGCMINKLASITVNEGYGLLDFAIGIPGSVGGCIYGNAGCYGSDISKILISAEVFDGDNVIEYKNEDFKFHYRDSILKREKKNCIILSCKFKIEKSNKEELKKLVQERTKKRMETQDLSHPSNGSMFRNPEGDAAGRIIDELGLKGFHVNDIMVSNKHANFIINNGKGSQKDVIELIDIIKREVKKKYNIDLVLEQEIVK